MNAYVSRRGMPTVALSEEEHCEGCRLVAERIAELRDVTVVTVVHDAGPIATVRVTLDSGDEMDVHIDPLNLRDRASSAGRLN